MKKLRLWPLFLGIVLSLNSCAFAKAFEKDLAFEVYDGTALIQSGTINIFNNAVLPEAEPKGDLLFYRYLLGDEAFDKLTTPKELLLPNAGLLRYNDVLPYAKDGTLHVHTVYLSADEMPRSYLKIGWYDRSRTSLVDQETIDRWMPDLHRFLTGYGASEEEIADVEVLPYGNGGPVADLGAAVNKDGLVDILLGVGNNVDSTANIPIVEKYQILKEDGSAWRYIALLSNRRQSRAVYEWLKSFDGHRALTGE